MPLCSFCKKECRLAAKGLCGTCYARYQRNGTAEYVRPNRKLGVTECSFCSSVVGPFVKSLCHACYQRQYKTGSTDRTRTVHLCEAPNCDDVVVAHGLCQRHYMRLRRHGSTDAGRPEGWGAKRKHPMYEAWQSMRRGARLSGGNDPRWEDFWAFLEDVGERPDGHRLWRKDQSKPFSKDNCEWRGTVTDAKFKVTAAEYQKAYRVKRPRIVQRTHLKKLYGITLEEYERMHEAQGGVCAICKCAELKKHKITGEVMMLAVDHDHTTGKIRGLLCSQCNHGLGNFRDSRSLLQAASAYLFSHGSE